MSLRPSTPRHCLGCSSRPPPKPPMSPPLPLPGGGRGRAGGARQRSQLKGHRPWCDVPRAEGGAARALPTVCRGLLLARRGARHTGEPVRGARHALPRRQRFGLGTGHCHGTKWCASATLDVAFTINIQWEQTDTVCRWGAREGRTETWLQSEQKLGIVFAISAPAVA